MLEEVTFPMSALAEAIIRGLAIGIVNGIIIAGVSIALFNIWRRR
jgi:hypothetical protein